MNFDLWTIHATHNAWQGSQDKFDKNVFPNPLCCKVFNVCCNTIRSMLQNHLIHVAKHSIHIANHSIHVAKLFNPSCKAIQSELQNHLIWVIKPFIAGILKQMACQMCSWYSIEICFHHQLPSILTYWHGFLGWYPWIVAYESWKTKFFVRGIMHFAVYSYKLWSK